MTCLSYQDGRLHMEQVDLCNLAACFGTPLYVYSQTAMHQAFKDLDQALCTALVGRISHEILYAVKANSALGIVKTFADLGGGADVVSIGELKIALAGGHKPEKIVFAGVAKQEHELKFALEQGICQINVESQPELLALERVAESLGLVAPLAIRVNPNVDAKTHAKITTGKAENKFGVEFPQALEMATYCQKSPWLRLESLSMHIGSQLIDLAPYRDAYGKLAALARQISGLKRLDIGGGLGIDYAGEATIDPQDYAQVVVDTLADMGLPLVLEPGRYLVGNAGVLLAQVVYVKEVETRNFLMLDAGMNDLLRPALYEAHHEIKPLHEPVRDTKLRPFDVVGPICESGDTFAQQRLMPPLKAGDLLAFESAGAYTAVMASTYNARPVASQVMVKGKDVALLTERKTVEDLIAEERLADWQKG